MDKHRVIEDIVETLLFIAAILAICLLSSCRTQQFSNATQRDSVRIVERLDSIYIYERDSIYIYEKADTVFVNKWHTRYKDVITMVHDTCYLDRVQETTIQVPYITKAQRNMIAGFWTLLVLLIIGVALSVWKNWKHLVAFFAKLLIR